MVAKKINLVKLRLDQKIATPEGYPTAAFQRWVNDNNEAVEKAYAGLAQQVTDITAALELAGIALQTATNANNTANNAQKAAALATSYTNPTGVLSADISTADPAKAKIVIASHNRVYGDGASVAVTGMTLDSLPQGTLLHVFYDDPARTGGTVTFQTTTDVLTAGQTVNRHNVGAVLTPTTAQPAPTTGVGPRPPGTQYSYVREDVGEIQ